MPDPRPARRPARLAALGATLAVVALAACGGGAGADAPTAPGPRLEVREMILIGDNGDTIFSHTDHWHGFPLVRAGQPVRYTLYFVAGERSADDHDIPARAEWFTLAQHGDVRVTGTIEQPAMASWDGDRLAGTLAGRLVGASRLSFLLLRGNTTIEQAPPLPFTVR